MSVTGNGDAKGFVEMHVGYKKVAKARSWICVTQWKRRRNVAKAARVATGYRERRREKKSLSKERCDKRRRSEIRDKNREEKSGPRFAGCDGGARSGLSHVDFGVKATIQSVDEASAEKNKGWLQMRSNSIGELIIQGHRLKWPEVKEEKERERRVPSFWEVGRPRSHFSSSDSARTWPFSEIGLFVSLFLFFFLLQSHLRCTNYFLDYSNALSWSPHLIISPDQARDMEYLISPFENSLGNIGSPSLSRELLFLVSHSRSSLRSFLLDIWDWMTTYILGVSMAYYQVLADCIHPNKYCWMESPAVAASLKSHQGVLFLRLFQCPLFVFVFLLKFHFGWRSGWILH